MGIMDKIENIRQKPEHIRMRYVWFLVTIVMIFILALWIFSLNAEFGKTRRGVDMPQASSFPVLMEKESAGIVDSTNKEGFNTDFGGEVDLNTKNQTNNISQ